DPGRRARVRARPERDHGGDWNGEDDPRAGHRPPARRARRRRVPRPGGTAEPRLGGEEVLFAARRVFADGRTRAYAWGRAVPREDLATLVERLLAMSGQFEQRRLARPSFQLDVLDAFLGEEQLRLRTD